MHTLVIWIENNFPFVITFLISLFSGYYIRLFLWQKAKILPGIIIGFTTIILAASVICYTAPSDRSGFSCYSLFPVSLMILVPITGIFILGGFIIGILLCNITMKLLKPDSTKWSQHLRSVFTCLFYTCHFILSPFNYLTIPIVIPKRIDQTIGFIQTRDSVQK